MLFIRCKTFVGANRLNQDGAILIDGSKIIAVGAALTLLPPSGAQIIDAHDFCVVPGYIDWQVNGGFGMDFTDNPGSIWEVARRLPEHGVTSFLPTIITAPQEVYNTTQRVLQSGAPSGFDGAQPLGLHFEGPFLNPAKKGAHNPAYLRNPDVVFTRSWSRKNGVWVVTLAPENPGASDLIQLLLKRGIVLSVGHSMADLNEARHAFQLGISAATHLFNAMPALDHRAPGLAAAVLIESKVTTGIIPDGIHVHPAMINLAWKQKGPRSLTIVTDAMSALGMQPGKYGLGDFEVTVDESSARLENGTLAGSILRMDQAVRNLMTFTGCNLKQAVAAATINVALLIGARKKGRLTVGADADLLLLDDHANVMATLVRGKQVFSRL